MSFVNLYNPPPPADPPPGTDTAVDPDGPSLYGPSPYDINFAFPLDTAWLESTHVRLTPFIPRVHARAYWDAVAPVSTELFRHFGIAWATMEENLAYIEKSYRQSPENILFAIIDKTRSGEASAQRDDDAMSAPPAAGSLAGVISLLHTSSKNLTAEIGYTVVLPAFQRTHVAAHAVGLLLRYCLDLPSASPPGLGLRRVQWMAYPENIASIRLAEKMGFKREGVFRWMWAVSDEEGVKPRKGDSMEDKTGRDTVILAICWDDWEEGGRSRVQSRISA
ncbi:acyl-CoA N-acyltransferase [Rhodofomes roseus]|uniref:Acyl-CoA N-acyltransferase n=1 Tax=Rhodofomes roseus TaxID=34475 RepID=A0ABQ8KIW6_9APHY|nr:acyl-CoA N-acyltransferase [Rhodofomes roseus]KAH9837904.1 acyl-CoA N-acyltransferase [Rhodofomes roseus]